MVVGISGGCGGTCPVLRRGECETQDEMEGDLSAEDRAALRMGPNAKLSGGAAVRLSAGLGVTLEPVPLRQARNQYHLKNQSA